VDASMRNAYEVFICNCFPKAVRHRCSSTASIRIHADVDKYTHYLFAVIDRNRKGTFTFEVSRAGDRQLTSDSSRIISSPYRFSAVAPSTRNYVGSFVSTICKARVSFRVKYDRGRSPADHVLSLSRTHQALADTIRSLYELLGSSQPPALDETELKKHVDDIIQV
jgi:hypothetical protein